MQNSVAKKLFAVGVAGATALMSLAPLAVHAALHAAGTNVKSSDGTVWMITTDGMRRPYTSAGAFLSYGFNSFASLVDASAEDLALQPGSFIPPQDGSIICSDRGTDKGTCYFISGGMKYGFTSAAVFTGLGFSFSRAKMGDVSWMAPGASLINSSSMAHLTGTLINKAGTVYLVGANGNLLGIPDLATFNSWGYTFANVVPANAADTGVQTGVMAARVAGQLSPSWTTSGTPGTPSPVSGSVSAALAADTPAAQTLAISSAVKSVVTLSKFQFTGSGSVTQLQVKRIGVSSDSDLSNVYLFNGDTRLTDAASVGGSSMITFSNPSGLFSVNGSVTVSVVAEIPANTSSGKTIGAQLTSFTVGNGSPATVAISGNLVTTSNVGTDLAYVSFGTVTPGDTASQSRDPQKDTEVFRSNVTVNNRDMTMSRLIMRNIGSAQQADINNFRLRIDGTQVAQTQTMDSNGYVYFSFSPMTLKAGNRIVSVLADLIGGSSRTFQFQIRNAADVNFVDSQYGVSVSSSSSFPVGSANSVSISSGSMTIVKASDSPSGNVIDGSSSVSLAKFTVTAYGEAQKIETLTVSATSSKSTVGSLRNGRLLINGVQYGSTAALVSNYPNTGTSYTLNYTVQPGTPVTLEVQADMFDNDGVNNLASNDTVTAYILTGSSNVQKMVSLGYTGVPSSAVAGNSLTDVTGSATLTKNLTYASQVAPLPQVSYKLGSFNLTGNSSEDININSIDLGIIASTTLTSLYNVKVMVNGNMFGTQKGSASVNATSTFSGNVALPKSTTIPVEVYADINAPTAAYASDTFKANLAVNGTTVNSSATVYATTLGQTISIGNSSLTAALDPSTPVSAITAGNQTKTAAAFKFTSANDQYTVSEVVISLTDASNVSSVVLKDGSTVLATQAGAASTTFSGLTVVVPANSTKILTVDLQLGSTGFGAGTSGANAQVTLHSYKSAPSSTGAISPTTAAVAANNLYVFKAIPTLTNVTLPTTVLQPGGTNTLAKFSISSGGTGTIGWTRIKFTYSTSSGVSNLSSFALWDADTNTQITGGTTVSYSAKTVIFDATTEQQISGAKNYVLKATVTGGSTTGDYVATYIAQPSSPASPTDAATATGTTASLVWSDVSAQSHDLTKSDWNNDYLVKNLPTDSQTLVK